MVVWDIELPNAPERRGRAEHPNMQFRVSYGIVRPSCAKSVPYMSHVPPNRRRARQTTEVQYTIVVNEENLHTVSRDRKSPQS
jgi:hypothetical protein